MDSGSERGSFLPPWLDDEPMSPLEAHATLMRILGAIEEYVYTGEFLPDDSYRVVFAGPCRERFLGMSAEAARAAVWANYVHPRDMDAFNAAHNDAHVTGQLDVEYRLIGADGRVRWVRDRGRMREEDGRRFLDGSVLDVTAVRSTQQALADAHEAAERASQRDPLTGVLNRRTLTSTLAERSGRDVGVVLIDIDHFKRVNDLCGHATGDAVLVAVAERLVAATRLGDAVFRMGGEEFLVLVDGVPDDAALFALGEGLRRAVRTEPVAAGTDTVAITVSVGAARGDASTGELEAVLAAADRALYGAKRRGRDQVCIVDPGLEAEDEPPSDESDALRLADAVARTAAAAGVVSLEHLEEVAALAARIARRLGASPSQVLRCRIAGLLHDIGKVRTGPDAPGSAHAVAGADLIEQMPELRAIAAAVRHHAGPVTERTVEIPFEARIVGVADAWATASAEPGARRFERLVEQGFDARLVAALRSVITTPREAEALAAGGS